MREPREGEKIVGMLRLEVFQGGASWRFESPPCSEVSIGRSVDCDLPITARKVSRRHARIVEEGGAYFIVDDGSTNGTLLGGEEISRARLSEGDELIIGTARIVVRSLPGGGRASEDPVAVSFGASRPAREGGADRGPGRGEGTDRRRRRPARRRSARRGVRWFEGAAVTGALLATGVLAVLVGRAVMERGKETPGGLSREDVERGGEPPVNAFESSNSAALDALESALSGRAAGGRDVGGEPFVLLDEDEAGKSRAGEGSPVLSGADDESRSRLATLVEEARRGEFGWETMEYLRHIVESSFDPVERREAAQHLALLEGVRAAVSGERREALERQISRLVGEARFGDAAVLAEGLARAAPSEDERELWSQRRAEIQERARRSFDDLEGELTAFLEEEKPAAALERLLEARDIYRGLSFYESLVGDYLGAAREPEPESISSSPVSPEANRLLDEAAVAFDECRFRDLARIRYSLLAMELSPRERLEQSGELFKAAYMGRMFDDVLEALEDEPLGVSLIPGEEGSVLGADRDTIEYQLRVDQSAYRSSMPWSQLTPSTKLKLFAAAPLSVDGQVGLALFSFELADIGGAHRALLELRRMAEHRNLADSVLAWHRGEPVPEGGYVVHEGRLVTPEERDLAIARLERIREEERAAQEELRKLERSSRLSAFVDFARLHRKKGNFELAQTVLQAINGRFGSSEEGATARRLLEDPVLNVEVLEENGPPENRLDFYFLGEGYPVADDYQAAFLDRARVAMNLLLAEEPFNEYRSYLSFRAVQLGSRDRGVDRQPGGVERDTALEGKVVYDRFTVDRSKTLAILARLGMGGRDGQALVIGNDYAGVSTGGGGVSAVTKVALTSFAHEIGHSLAGLRDEYDFRPGMGPERRGVRTREENVPTRELPPNLMEGSDRGDVLSRVLWKHWIEAGEDAWWNRSKVSVFEGANLTPFNTWRPQAMCKMRSSATRFCVVCMEVMVLRIYDYVRPIDRAEPEAETIDLASGEEARVKVWPMKPEGRFLEAEWTLERLPGSFDEEGPTIVASEPAKVPLRRLRRLEPEGGVVEMVLLRARELERGGYRLRVDVRDTTPWVLRDPDGRLKDSREWIVRVGGE